MRIGRYEIERELGRGAMGVVYLATDPRVRRRVALKTWHVPEGLKEEQREEFRQRFLREAQAAGALSHPAIVTVHDADDDPGQGVPYIVMEYVEGRSLDAVLAEDGPLDPELACRQAAAVAEALEQAHAAGIVHRDIKPANLLIPEGGAVVKVADFGVAKMASSELTKTGSSLGSPAYMSPEQIRGQPVDGRSDLFSLAAVLYECLCGERPFAAADLTALAYAVVYETPVPVTRKRPGLPPGLDAFFDRALAKKPEDRFPGARAFRDALQAALTETAPLGTGTLELVDAGATVADAGPVLEEAGRPGGTISGGGDGTAPAGGPGHAAGRERSARSAKAGDGSGTAAAGAGSPPAPDQPVPVALPASGSPAAGSTAVDGPGAAGADTPATAHAAAAAGHLGALLLRGGRASGRGFLAAGAVILAVLGWAGRSAMGAARWAGRSAPGAARRAGRLDRRVLKAAAAAAVLALIILGGWAMMSGGVPVRIEGVNGFREAELTLFVDGREVWSRSLAAEKKKASFLGKKLFNYGTEEFGGSIRLDPGKREIEVAVLPEGEDEPYRDRIRVRLKPGEKRTLEIKTGKGLGRPVSIDLD